MDKSKNIAGFEIIEILGEGGMGTVYKARQLSLDRIVAVKILKPHLVESEEDVARFQLEAKAAAKLNHPGIVHVYDAGKEGGKYYFAMEFVEGHSVGDWLARKGKIPESDALAVGACVSAALEHAWEQAKIIHRDIKPDNILIDKDGVVKVADLGLVKLGGRDDTAGDEDEQGALTPNYCSPEQAGFLDQIDFRADIYSLGATLYHMVTGKLPFAGEDPHEVLRQQVSGSLPDPRDHVPDLSDGTAILLRRLMAKKPDERYTSWAQAGRDIDLVTAGKHPAEALAENAMSTVVYKPSKSPAIKASSKGQKPGGKRVVVKKQNLDAVAAHLAARKKKKHPIRKLVGLLILAGLGYGGYRAYQQWPVLNIKQEVTGGQDLSAILEEAKAFTEQHPEDYDGAIAIYNEVVSLAAGTEYEATVTLALEKLTQLRKQEIAGITADLEAQAEQFIAERKFNQARQLVRDYNGPFAKDTHEARQSILNDLQVKISGIKQASQKTRKEEERKEKLQAAQAALPEGLVAISEAYQRAWQNVRKRHQEKLDVAGQRYRAMLEKVEGRARQTGELELVLAIRKEIERFDDEKSLPETVSGSPPALLREAITRGILISREGDVALNKQKAKLNQEVIGKLLAEQKKLVAEKRIDEAIKVKEIIQQIKEEGEFPSLVPRHLEKPLERSSAFPEDEASMLCSMRWTGIPFES